jgi:hypothetical protein
MVIQNVMTMKLRYILPLCVTLALPGCLTVQSRQAGIHQFVETRDGRESVWGIDINLDLLSFSPEIQSEEITITDGKYGRDLKKIMTWTVSSDRKCLQIRFKPSMGDFGTGNGVTVHIQKSAMSGRKDLNNRYEWSMLTDIQ